MTSKYDSLSYELESRLRSRLFIRAEYQIKINLFELTSKTYSNRLYEMTSFNLNNQIKDNLNKATN